MPLKLNYRGSATSDFKKYLILFLLLALGISHSYAQSTQRDSLVYRINDLRSEPDFKTRDSVFISLLNKLGDQIRYYKADSLLLLSKEAYKYSSASDNGFGKSHALIGIGNYYSDKGDYKKAIANYHEALQVAKVLDDKNLILEIQNSIAGSYDYKGDYAEALSRYLECIELATQIKNDVMLSIINENIANLYAVQKDYDQAIYFFKIVKRINQRIGNEVYSAETLSNLASVYSDMGELEYAMYNINSSITVFEKHKIMDWLAYAYEIKGKTYLKEGDYKWALFWYKQSEMIHENLDDNRAKTSLLNGMAEAYLGQRKDSLSEQYAINAFNISKKIKFHEETQKSAKTLYQINKNKQDFNSALAYHELFQTLHDTITTNKNQKNLTMLVTKLEFERQKENLISENEKALAKQKSYVYAALVILFIFLVVTFLFRRSERIQKKLNLELYHKTTELVKNEKELRDINETKDKLFSIIGHDLRGPIGAFQGLVKLYRDNEIGKEEFLSFIPKLGADIDHISFTLNNLLSWGQTQMNGSTTKPTVVPLENIVDDNINLHTEIATSKSIKLINKLPTNTLAWTDSNQIDVVLRNLISNALKFTPEKGMITIDAIERTNNWEISVRDNGVGMNQEMQAKIFSKSSNVTTYGTNNEKGTGLGLSLCKEMVEKNNGTIWVESIPNRGTCFSFTTPKANAKPMKKLQKAG